MADDAAFCPKCGTGANGAPAAKVEVPNYLVWSILTTVFCCLIGGIVAIVYSSQVNTKLARGDVEGAKASARSAKNWIIANVIIGGLLGLAQIALVVVQLMQRCATSVGDAEHGLLSALWLAA